MKDSVLGTLNIKYWIKGSHLTKPAASVTNYSTPILQAETLGPQIKKSCDLMHPSEHYGGIVFFIPWHQNFGIIYRSLFVPLTLWHP